MRATRLWILLVLQLTSSAVASRSRTTSSEFQSAPASAPCTGVPTVPSNRKACGFYIWDAPSALLYKWCHHLMKDHLYEGKGGHMFVRYESNSILQLLYPCSRYSPNRCMVCGGSYQDHLELWWSKYLYTPFDRYLDKTYEAALILGEERGKSRASKSQKVAHQITGPPRYAFHKRYVQDVSDWVRGERDVDAQMKLIKKQFAREKKNSGIEGLRLTNFPQHGISYVIPQAKGEGQKRLSYTLRFVRSLVLSNLDNLIMLQETENKKLQRKGNQQ